MDGAVACMEETRNAYNILVLVRKAEGRRPLKRLRDR
jgi:hypothetical protein